MEALSLGLQVYAQDLYPWPTLALAWSLARPTREAFDEAAKGLLAYLGPLALPRKDDGEEVIAVIRVRVAECRECSTVNYIYSKPLVSKASRHQNEEHGYFGCPKCGEITRSDLTGTTFECATCGSEWPKDRFPYPTQQCSGCGKWHDLSDEPIWKSVLLSTWRPSRGRRALLRPVEPSDPIDDIPTPAEKVLNTQIRDGKETRRLLDQGYVTWADLYSQRQLVTLARAFEYATGVAEPAVRDRLLLSVAGMIGFPAHLCRWDRSVLKVHEATANHRYAHVTECAELNLLAGMGRGTLPSRLRHEARGLSESCTQAPVPKVKRLASSSRRLARVPQGITLATGDSTRQVLPKASVDLVLTDPPYFDDIQYGEMARLTHAWLPVMGVDADIDEQPEAVPNSIRGTTAADYQERIAAILTESRRTLKPTGRLILTYRNSSPRAWDALAKALKSSNFYVHALAVARAENPGNLVTRVQHTGVSDLVLECAPVPPPGRAAEVAFSPETIEAEYLLKLGSRLATHVNTRACTDFESHDLTSSFARQSRGNG